MRAREITSVCAGSHTDGLVPACVCSHRWALLRNMVTDLIKHERIQTTLAKAKEARAPPICIGAYLCSCRPFRAHLCCLCALFLAVLSPQSPVQDEAVRTRARGGGTLNS